MVTGFVDTEYYLNLSANNEIAKQTTPILPTFSLHPPVGILSLSSLVIPKSVAYIC